MSIAALYRQASVVTETPEYACLRRLLSELRPASSGPLAFGPEATPPPAGALDRPRVVVSASAGMGAGLPGRPRGLSREAEAMQAATARIDAAPPGPRATLEWLRLHGTLASGVGALYARCGYETAPEPLHARWKSSQESRREGAPMRGRRVIREAATAWWGTLPEGLA